MTTPTKHLEILQKGIEECKVRLVWGGKSFSDYLSEQAWKQQKAVLEPFCQQHLIQTVISVLEQQIQDIETSLDAPPPYNAVINNPMMHCYQNQGYIQGLVNSHGLLESTLSTWKALLE